jgi:type IV pilus assembly protein PilN
MARINLLPWREERREENQKQFFMTIAFAVIVATFILYSVVSFFTGLLEEQNQRNQFLNKEIAVLDIKIKEISQLDKERARLLSRMEVIQNLQASRPKVVKVFESLVNTVPEGIYLTKLTRSGSTLLINGIAQSNARVSVFMRKLDENSEFNEAKLKVIKKSSPKDEAVTNFTLEVTESKPKQSDL